MDEDITEDEFDAMPDEGEPVQVVGGAVQQLADGVWRFPLGDGNSGPGGQVGSGESGEGLRVLTVLARGSPDDGDVIRRR
jgi:hypothetical protein